MAEMSCVNQVPLQVCQLVVLQNKTRTCGKGLVSTRMSGQLVGEGRIYEVNRIVEENHQQVTY
jgi:hypothetical protein